MKDEYLWDRSGAPDREVERLEQVLAPLRYQHRELRPAGKVRGGARWAVAAAVIGAAAALVLAVAPAAPATHWEVAGAKLHRGQVVRTASAAVRWRRTQSGVWTWRRTRLRRRRKRSDAAQRETARSSGLRRASSSWTRLRRERGHGASTP